MTGLLAGCDAPTAEPKGTAELATVCQWRESAWSDTFTRSCASLPTLDLAQLGLCYENSSVPLVIDVEPMQIWDGQIDLSVCLTADDAEVWIGTPDGNQFLSSGTLEAAADSGVFGFLTADDKTRPCFGATVLVSGTYASGTGFDTNSWYWKDGTNSTNRTMTFGSHSSDGIAANAASITLPSPQLIPPVPLMPAIDHGLATLITLDAASIDHWSDPYDPECE